MQVLRARARLLVAGAIVLVALLPPASPVLLAQTAAPPIDLSRDAMGVAVDATTNRI